MEQRLLFLPDVERYNMEIISGDAAYRITEEFRQDALNKVINEYTEIFIAWMAGNS